MSENVFLSGGLDGKLRLWDMRKEDEPLSTLKRSGKSSDEYKVFALEWNGPSQILSGGSDSHISVHEMASE